MRLSIGICICIAITCSQAELENDKLTMLKHIFLKRILEKEKATLYNEVIENIMERRDSGCSYNSVEGYVTRWLKGGNRAQTSIDKCERFCETSGSKCWGFDRDESRDRCYFLKLNSWNPIDQYVKEPCDGSCEYTKLEATFSPGGKRIFNMDNYDECEEHCSENEFCLGFDYDGRYDACYEHSSPLFKANGNRRHSLGGSFFQRFRGQDGDADTFKGFDKKYSEGFIFNIRVPRRPRSTDDLAEMCKESCLKNENCEGVNVDFDFMVCQHVIMISVQVYEKGGETQPGSGEHEYTESDTTWSYNVGSYLGDESIGYECQLGCSSEEDCVAISYSSDVPGCWTYSSEQFEELKNMKANVHYRKQCD